MLIGCRTICAKPLVPIRAEYTSLINQLSLRRIESYDPTIEDSYEKSIQVDVSTMFYTGTWLNRDS